MSSSKCIAVLSGALLVTLSSFAWAEGPAKLSVAAPVEGGQLSIDGKPVGPLPVAGLELEPGRHEIIVTKDGHSTYRKWVIARPGTVTEVVAVLVPVTRAEETPKAEPPKSESPVASAVTEAPQDQPVYKKWWFWTAIGTAVVAGTVVAVVVASGGDDFVPSGELGRTSISDWTQP